MVKRRKCNTYLRARSIKLTSAKSFSLRKFEHGSIIYLKRFPLKSHFMVYQNLHPHQCHFENIYTGENFALGRRKRP